MYVDYREVSAEYKLSIFPYFQELQWWDASSFINTTTNYVLYIREIVGVQTSALAEIFLDDFPDVILELNLSWS